MVFYFASMSVYDHVFSRVFYDVFRVCCGFVAASSSPDQTPAKAMTFAVPLNFIGSLSGLAL